MAECRQPDRLRRRDHGIRLHARGVPQLDAVDAHGCQLPDQIGKAVRLVARNVCGEPLPDTYKRGANSEPESICVRKATSSRSWPTPPRPGGP
jgi:hypothetical protein